MTSRTLTSRSRQGCVEVGSKPGWSTVPRSSWSWGHTGPRRVRVQGHSGVLAWADLSRRNREKEVIKDKVIGSLCLAGALLVSMLTQGGAAQPWRNCQEPQPPGINCCQFCCSSCTGRVTKDEGTKLCLELTFLPVSYIREPSPLVAECTYL